ncbi:NAD(P) transhydrogenase subunit alpha [Inquilinus sp. CAU 1745]|uniref:NAD(P) transhydrogenase subunit alpha n=1 Tax=Inquilinus sp. CAU 1745 TaxID=3140369 RepID=UPI00325A8D83
MEPETLAQSAAEVATEAQVLADRVADLAVQATRVTSEAASAGHDFLVVGLTVFVLACFVGYYVVWRVTPALHSPLMSVTNAVSSVIIVGALIAAGPAQFGFGQAMGFLAVILASVNIFGGFIVTHRMLSMYKKKKK